MGRVALHARSGRARGCASGRPSRAGRRRATSPPGRSHPRQLSHDELGSPDVVQDAQTADDVELAVPERERHRRRRSTKRAVGGAACSRGREVAPSRVDADDRRHARRRARTRTRPCRNPRRARARRRRAAAAASSGAPRARQPVRAAARRGARRVSAIDDPPRRRAADACSGHTRSRTRSSPRRARAPRHDPVADQRHGRPRSTGPGSSTASTSIETVPTTRRRSPATSTSVPVRSRRKPSA